MGASRSRHCGKCGTTDGHGDCPALLSSQEDGHEYADAKTIWRTMKIDLAGVQHPTLDDIPDEEGLLHIASCTGCQDTFGGFLANVARVFKAEREMPDL